MYQQTQNSEYTYSARLNRVTTASGQTAFRIYKNCSRSRIEIRPTTLLRYHAHTRWTLTFLWPWLSIPCELRLWSTNRKKLHFKGQSVQNIEWKRTDGQTDGRTDATDCFSFPANADGKNVDKLTAGRTNIFLDVTAIYICLKLQRQINPLTRCP